MQILCGLLVGPEKLHSFFAFLILGSPRLRIQATSVANIFQITKICWIFLVAQRFRNAPDINLFDLGGQDSSISYRLRSRSPVGSIVILRMILKLRRKTRAINVEFPEFTDSWTQGGSNCGVRN